MNRRHLLVALGVVVALALLHPAPLHAWTPGTHIYLGEAVLGNLPQLPGARLHLGLALALLLSIGLWVFGRWTLAGFALRATGANPVAAAVEAGIKIENIAESGLIDFQQLRSFWQL